MILAGERELVNIMADTGLGSTSVKNVFAGTRGRGLISKREKLSGKGVKKATSQRTAGQSVTRISGEPFVARVSEAPLEVSGEKIGTEEIGDQTEKSVEMKAGQPSSAGIEQISTSLNSFEVEVRNSMGELSSRLKRLEQGNSTGDKKTPASDKPRPEVVDLGHQSAQAPPATIEDATDDDSQNEEEKVTEGSTKTKLVSPDGTEYIELLPTPFVKELQNRLQGFRRVEEDVTNLGVGEPYTRPIELKGQGTRRVVEINPKCEILFDYFARKHKDAPETKDLTAFVNMCIEFFAWTQNTQIRIGQEEILHLSPIFQRH